MNEEKNELMTVEMTPMQMVRYAIDKGATPETLEKIMDLQERVEKSAAKKAWFDAMAKFKKHQPDIYKLRPVDVKKEGKSIYQYKFAPLEVMDSAIRKIAEPLGLYHRWEPSTNGEKTRITCIVAHDAGHSESCYMEWTGDNSGGKNALQGIGSTGSYLQRYTLAMIYGIVIKDQDNDGNYEKYTLDESVLLDHLGTIRSSSTIEELHKVYSVAYKVATESKDQNAQRHILAAKDTKKAELAKGKK